jgi:hydroxyacylglutathione hydrolase
MLKLHSFVFNPMQENTYLLSNETGQCIIIDPGCYFEQERTELSNYIRDNTLSPVLLLNTHCHLDHVFGNKYMAQTYNLELHLHEKEKKILQQAPLSGMVWKFPFEGYTGNLLFLEEGEQVRLGDDVLDVLFLPGHSPGSIGFYCAAQSFIIGGDVLFKRGIGRTDLQMSNHADLMASIKEKLFALPDEVKVYSGHGEVTTIGEEKQENPFFN